MPGPIEAGKNLVFKVRVGGVMTDISCYVSGVKLQQTMKMLDAVTGCGRAVKPSHAEYKIPLDGPFSALEDAILGPLFNPEATAETNWEFYPIGSTSGKPKYSGGAWFTEYALDSKAGDVAKWSGNFEPSTVTRAVVA